MLNPYKKLSGINPQTKNGHREIENSVFQALIRSRLLGAEFRVTMLVIDKSWGFSKPSATLSFSKIEKCTLLSRQSVMETIKGLEERHIIVVERPGAGKMNSYLFNKHWDTWLTGQPQHTTQLDQGRQPQHTKVGNHSIPEWATTAYQGRQLVTPTTVPVKKLLKKPIKETLKEKEAQGPEPPDFNEWRKKVFEGLKTRRGYNSPNAGAEAGAITWMLKQGYTVENILAAHDKLKQEPFWAAKFLNMQSLKSQIGELQKGGKYVGTDQGKPKHEHAKPLKITDADTGEVKEVY